MVDILPLLTGFAVVVLLVLAKADTIVELLKRIYDKLPEPIKDELWYFWFYVIPKRCLRQNSQKILLESLDKRNIAIFLEMDYQYSEQLVRLYDEFYTNYVVIWDRFKNNEPVYNLLCKQMKSEMIKTFKKANIDRNNAHIRLAPPLSEQRKLETIIINDRINGCQEFGIEMKYKMKMPDQNNRCRCVVVPMLTEEVIDYVKTGCYDVDKVLIFTILEIPSKEQFEKIEGIEDALDNIVYAPLISQEIIRDYYKEKYNKER